MADIICCFPADGFAARLKKYRKAAGMTQGELASRLSLRQSAVSNWEQGLSKPDLTLLTALSAALDISVGELLGESPRQLISDDERDVLRRFRRLNDSNRRVLNITMDAMLTVQGEDKADREETDRVQEIDLRQFKRVLELQDHAAAGTGTPMSSGRYEKQHTFLRMDSPAAAKTDLIVTVNGDSMEPHFHHGDRLSVKKTEQLNYGEIGVFIVNNELFVKQYQANGLISLNPDFPHVEIHEDDQVRCVGKVTGTILAHACADGMETAILEELWRDKIKRS